MYWRYLIAITAIMVPADAAMGAPLLHRSQEHVSMPAPFVAAMTRTRLAWLTRGSRPLGQPIEHEASLPSRIPFYWENESGASIRRMGDNSFRLEDWSPHANWGRAITCQPAGWPNYDCSDGIPRSMSAPDLNTLIFGGRSFNRLLPSADPVIDPPSPALE